MAERPADRSGVASPAASKPPRPAARRTLWAALTLAVLGGLVGLVAATTGGGSVPTAITHGQGARVVDGRLVGLRLRDINGRVHPVPDRRPGVILFVVTHNCASCVRGVAVLGALKRRYGARVGAFAISAQSTDGRGDFTAFARAAGNPPVPFGLDTTLNAAANLLAPPGIDGAVVYDAAGRITARVANVTSAGALRRALREAGL